MADITGSCGFNIQIRKVKMSGSLRTLWLSHLLDWKTIMAVTNTSNKSLTLPQQFQFSWKSSCIKLINGFFFPNFRWIDSMGLQLYCSLIQCSLSQPGNSFRCIKESSLANDWFITEFHVPVSISDDFMGASTEMLFTVYRDQIGQLNLVVEFQTVISYLPI